MTYRFRASLPDTSKKYLKLDDRLSSQPQSFQRPSSRGGFNNSHDSKAARLARVQSSPDLPQRHQDKTHFGGLGPLKARQMAGTNKEKTLKGSKSFICISFSLGIGIGAERQANCKF